MTTAINTAAGRAPWALLAARAGAVALAAALLLRPLLRRAQFPRGELLLLALVFAGGILLTVSDADDGHAPKLPLGVGRSLAVFWVCVGASWLWSIHQMHSSQAVLGLLAWTVVLLAAARLADAPRWRPAVVYGLVGVSVLLAGLAVAQRVALFEMVRAHPAAPGLDPDRLASNRVFATFLSPGVYGSFLALLLPWQVGMADGALARTQRRRAAWVMGLAVLLNLVALVLTQSRTAWLATAVALLAYAGITRGRRAVAVLSVALAAFGALLLALRPTLAAADTLAARLTYWRGTLAMMRLRPLTGTGLGTWGDAYPTTFVPGGLPAQVAHNDWLQRFGETGVVGGIAFAVFAVAVLRVGARSWRQASDARTRRRAAGLWCGVLGVFAAAVLDYPFAEPPVAWIAGAAMGLLVGDGWGRSRPLPLRRWTWGHGAVAALLLGAAGATAYRYDRAAVAWRDATRAAAAQDLDAVKAACHEVMDWAPADPEPYGLLGTMYLRLGATSDAPAEVYGVAAAATASAVARAPWSPWLADRAGLAQWRLATTAGDADAPAKAVDYFQRAVAHFPAHPGFRARLAGVLTWLDAPGAADARMQADAVRAAWRAPPGITGPTTLGADLDRW